MNDKQFIKTKVQKSLKQLLGIPYAGRQTLSRLELLGEIVASILLKGVSTIQGISENMNHGRRKLSSVKKQVSRFMKNPHINTDTQYFPFIKLLLEGLSEGSRLEIVIDGSSVGKGCMCLMMSVIYKKRAIPLIWKVSKKKKGHFTEAEHVALLKELRELISEQVEVIILGDGEFDGTQWQALITSYQWKYVLRTAKNKKLDFLVGESCRADSLAIEPGESLFLEHLYFGTQAYTWVNLLIWHGKGYEEPLYLVTNLDDGYLVHSYYIQRFLIETFFRDTKSKGFHIHRSGLRNPQKLDRLLMCCALAYVMGILAGVKATQSKFYDLVCEQYHHSLSLFQLGMRFIRKLVDLRQWRAFSLSYDLIRNR